MEVLELIIIKISVFLSFMSIIYSKKYVIFRDLEYIYIYIYLKFVFCEIIFGFITRNVF